MLMRWWYISRIALERRFEPHLDRQYGVYDRRPSIAMFLARIVSGCLAFIVFVYCLSSAGVHQPHLRTYLAPVSNSFETPVTGAKASLSYKTADDRNFLMGILLNGTRVKSVDGTELIFQKPMNTSLGTVLMLHGCSHSATDFFPRGESCDTCIGLPEEMRMTRAALQRGYSVVAVSSTDRARKCWKTHPKAEDGPDYDRVSAALIEAQSRGAYSPRLPLFAVGISSGGLFATSLPLRFRVAGVNAIVSAAVCLLWGDAGETVLTSYPPHVFTHMSVKDKRTAQRVNEARKILSTLGTASIEFHVSPTPVTVAYLKESVPSWNTSLVQGVLSALRRDGHLTHEDRLQFDPRSSSWRRSVQHFREALRDTFQPDESALSEELNRAWGAHEITSEYFTSAIEFLEKHLRP